jgi:uncharacterized protein with GYD domain
MARYVTLIRFTDQGARKLKASPARALAFAKAAKASGVTVETQLWTLGSHDGLLVLAGDAKKVLRCVTRLTALGNVRTETLPAFDAAEFESIVK